MIDFLQDQQAVIGTAQWRRVRLHPYFKNEDDIVNQLAFSRGALGITRGNDIYINVPYTPSAIEHLDEKLLFHELVHVAQYASGMNLPEYASSAAQSYATGDRPENNNYEEEAREKAKELVGLWAISPQRALCHPDLPEDRATRAPSEQPLVSFAIFSPMKGEYELVRYQLHKNRPLLPELPEQAAAKDNSSQAANGPDAGAGEPGQ